MLDAIPILSSFQLPIPFTNCLHLCLVKTAREKILLHTIISSSAPWSSGISTNLLVILGSRDKFEWTDCTQNEFCTKKLASYRQEIIGNVVCTVCACRECRWTFRLIVMMMMRTMNRIIKYKMCHGLW